MFHGRRFERGLVAKENRCGVRVTGNSAVSRRNAMQQVRLLGIFSGPRGIEPVQRS